ncbi:MAG: branched-chain amino acid ABC transporter permease [Streptosporangiales bacterium]
MSLDAILAQVLNGIGNGMIYFLIAVGLTVIFGIMDFVNFAHGAFYLFGAYLTYQAVQLTGSFWAGIIIGPVIVAIVALALERVVLQHLYGADHTYQIILTFGVALIAVELVILMWTATPRNVPTPDLLQGRTNLLVLQFPNYRIFVILLTAALAVAIWFGLERTRFGAIVRAGTESIDMVSSLGINIRLVFALTFAVGAGLAALGGVLAAPMQGLNPFIGQSVLGLAFVVVVVGGMGSFSGALVAGLLIGIIQSLTVMVWPVGGNVVIYVFMAAVLLGRQAGLLGRKSRAT